MPGSNERLVLNCIAKARGALSDAEYVIQDNRYNVALNRLYYAIFYAVQALAYNDDFITSKHSQLMGWFNKKFIYDQQIFPKRMNEVYSKAYMNRQEADYDLMNDDDYSGEEINLFYEDSKFFVSSVEEYLNRSVGS